MTKILISIIIILIIIIIYQIYNNYNNEFMNGLWIAEPEFCDEAGIDNMMFYINIKSKLAYVIIEVNGNVIENKILFNPGYRQIEIDLDIMPENVDYELDINKGKMIWKKNDIIYAVLYKDNISNQSS